MGSEEDGAAPTLCEQDLDTPELLLEAHTGLLTDSAEFAQMSENARTQAHPGAAERIAERLVELAGKG